MDVIGNNIANVNTTAFKASRATFQESFSQLLTGASRPVDGQGGVNAMQVGLGMELGSVDTIFTQGNLETTDIGTDMAIQGNSFFVVAQGNQHFYTRAGNFQPDADGRLVSPSNGYILQGLMATDGVLGGAVTDIKLPQGQTTPAKATTKVSFTGNIDFSAPVIAAADVTAPTSTELADPANAQSVVQTTLSVYDSLGTKHDLKLVAWKVSATEWDCKVDPTSLNYDTTATSEFNVGKLKFNADGTINAGTSTMPTAKFTPVGNGNALDVAIDTGSGTTGLTSYAAGSTALLRDQDGYGSGVLQSMTIGADGTIVGSFSNGVNQVLAQVALADFNNPEGLLNMGDNMYTVSSNSGSPVVGFSGKETSSTIASGALEMSNVDLAREFTNMIITQRGFQANGKMITTSDDMLQDLVNLKR
jgi:flagellar hook protein FlgE